MDSFTNSNYQFLCAVLVLLHTRVLCFQYKVGDLDAWGIPTSVNSHVYTNWAQKHHFQIGDSLCKLLSSFTQSSQSRNMVAKSKDPYQILIFYSFFSY